MNTEVQPELNEEISDEQLDAITSGDEIEEVSQEEPVVEEVKEAPKEEKTVPLAALHEARMQNREMRQRMQVMEQRFNQMVDAIQPKPEIPALEQDPVAHFDQRLAQMEAQAQDQQRRAEESQYYERVVGTYRQHAAQFSQQEPAFNEAYGFLNNGRTQQYVEAGYSPEQAAAMTQREEFAVINQAMQMGLNPAVMIYNMAQTYGWKPASKQEQKDLSAIQEGISKNKSLASAKGKGVESNVTLEAIAEMSDEDFNKFWKTMQDS